MIKTRIKQTLMAVGLGVGLTSCSFIAPAPIVGWLPFEPGPNSPPPIEIHIVDDEGKVVVCQNPGVGSTHGPCNVK